MSTASYNRGVFINCPFDANYAPLFRAAIFAIVRCGYDPRCAVEDDDSSDVRLTKILQIISECRLGIHDLSRTQLDKATRLPRFNMPFELGLFLAAKRFGHGEHGRKTCLVFERKSHSYEIFISDIKGQDVFTHSNKPELVIGRIRDWLACNSKRKRVEGGQVICRDYRSFTRWLPQQCRAESLSCAHLIFGDFVNLVYRWGETRGSRT